MQKDLKDVRSKNLGGRPSKNIKYIDEKKKVLQKLFHILKINDQNKNVFINDLDEDLNIQEDINHLSKDAKKYFNSGNWAYFKKKDQIKRPYLSLIKSILKDMKINTEIIKIYEPNGKKIKKSGFRILE